MACSGWFMMVVMFLKLRAWLVVDGSSRIDPHPFASLAHVVALAETGSRPHEQEYKCYCRQ